MSAATTIKTRKGEKLIVRPIEPGDKQAIATAFERLSPESRYRRFFAPLNRLNSSDLAYLTELDHHNHEALIVFGPKAGEDGGAVGIARFVRSERPEIAEVAVTIVDDWQHRGVASRLLEELVNRAREEGITHFLALILEENNAAVELFRHLAANDAEPERSPDGNLELLIELPEAGEVSDSLLGRALVAAAHGVQMNPWRLLKHRVHETAEQPLPPDERDR